MLEPHHDGSELYVSNPAPRIGEYVTLKVRIPNSYQIEKLSVRIMQDGEPILYPLRRSSRKRTDSWWSARVEIVSASTNYRFLIKNGKDFKWLNSAGVFTREVMDHQDFKLVSAAHPPRWLRSTVFYQIFPDRFAKSATQRALPSWAIPRKWSAIPALNQSEVSQEYYGGDLDGVREKLTYLKKLGVKALYFTPIFPSRSNHRYDASSFDEVDPLLGGDESLIDLRNAAARSGIKVMSDLTTNHCGIGHPWIQSALNEKNSVFKEFFYWSKKSNWGYVGWWNVPSLPKLNYKSMKLRDLMWGRSDSIVKKWLKPPYGLSGWRIDVGNMTGRFYDDNFNREVAKSIRAAVEDTNPEAWLVAENADFYSEDLDGFGWHGTMNYNGFTKPLWYWLNQTPREFKDGFGLPLPLPRIDAGAMVSTMQEFAAGIPWRSLISSMVLLGSHDRARFHTVVNKDVSRNLAGVTLLMTYPGVPSVYAGDELGLEGLWGENGRRTINWENKTSWNKDLLQGYKDLIALRSKSHALANGGLRWVQIEKDSISFLRESKRESLLIFVSRGKAKVKIDLRQYGYSIAKTLYGPPMKGRSISINSKGPISGIWRLA